MKKIIIALILIVVSVIAWWLISPLFINVEVNEKSPISFEEQENIIKDMKDKMVKDSMPKDTNTYENKKIGSFKDGASSYSVKGDLLLISNKKDSYLRFENFDATNGPDLFVVLSPNKNPVEDLGEIHIIEELKGNKGDQNYQLKDVSLDKYESVVIYCKAFSVVFGYTNIDK